MVSKFLNLIIIQYGFIPHYIRLQSYKLKGTISVCKQAEINNKAGTFCKHCWEVYVLFSGCWWVAVYHSEHLFLKGRVGYCRSSATHNLISTPVHNHVLLCTFLTRRSQPRKLLILHTHYSSLLNENRLQFKEDGTLQ